MRDVDVVTRPDPPSYQPDSTNLDYADQGKQFDVSCRIGPDGHMQDCQAEPNTITDPNFVKVAVDCAQKFVVGPTARDGQPTAGRTFVITHAFRRADADDHRTDVASNR